MALSRCVEVRERGCVLRVSNDSMIVVKVDFLAVGYRLGHYLEGCCIGRLW